MKAYTLVPQSLVRLNIGLIESFSHLDPDVELSVAVDVSGTLLVVVVDVEGQRVHDCVRMGFDSGYLEANLRESVVKD